MTRGGLRGGMAAWGVLVAALAAVTVSPQIDLATSGLFYVAGQGFPWRQSGLGQFVRHTVPRLILGSVVLCVIAWAVGLVRRRPIAGLITRSIAFLLSTLLIGPGLIVESVLKPYWGRARPDDLDHFGGAASYTPPLMMADACQRNCSFVSGHAAIAFWVTAYAVLAPKPYRALAWALALVFGAAIGLMRVMQGAHFLSDVLYAGAIVVGVNLLVARLILPPRAEA